MEKEKWINFKQLKATLDFRRVLDYYTVDLKYGEDQAQGYCPLPNHNGTRKSPSFSVHLDCRIWQCFGCGAKGNILDFAILMERLSPENPQDVRTVALKLIEALQLSLLGEPPKGPPGTGRKQPEPPNLFNNGQNPKPEVKVNEPLDFELKDLDHNHPYLQKRAFTPETMRYFGAGYCARGLMAGRVAIPLHNHRGQLLGYAGRVINDSMISKDVSKYRFPAKRERRGITHEFHKSAVVYNLHRLQGKVDRLILVEGFPSVWWLHQAGYTKVVSLIGWSCSEEQAKLILEKTTDDARLYAFPDGDEAGERSLASTFKPLGERRWMRWVKLNLGEQPTDCAADRLKQFFRA